MGIRTGLTVLLSLLAGSVSALEACNETVIHLRGDWGSARFTVDVADTPDLRSRGLMFVEEMPRMQGMLFVYEHEQTVAFWMKNTLIPLDMIFADGSGVVRRVHANAIPRDTTSIPGGSAIQFVLEINGGLAAQLGVAEGTQFRHPAIPQVGAAWPC